MALHIQDLRIGLYVKLECSWWRHPFTTSTFKVTHTGDLQKIRKIKKFKLFFDPDLSDDVEPEPESDLQDASAQSVDPPEDLSPESSEPKGLEEDRKQAVEPDLESTLQLNLKRRFEFGKCRRGELRKPIESRCFRRRWRYIKWPMGI